MFDPFPLPVTTPAELTVAIELLELQKPPEAPLVVKVTVLPIQTVELPYIVPVKAVTFTVAISGVPVPTV